MRPRYLENHSQRPLGGTRALLERSGDGLGGLHGRLQGAPELSWGPLGGLLGGFGSLLGSFLTLIDQIYESEEVFEAKTATYSKMTYLTALLLCFRGPKGSKMSSNPPKTSKKRRDWLVGWLVGWLVVWVVVGGGWREVLGGGSIRPAVARHLVAPGGTIGGEPAT